MSSSSAPLVGVRVLLTRPEGDAAQAWTVAFANAGAVVVAYPTIIAVPPPSWDELDAALADLDAYDWLIFTSQSAVAFVVARLPGRCFPAALRTRIAAVGPTTAAAVATHGGRVGLVPDVRRQEGLVEAVPAGAGARILLPMAAGARALLVDQLRARGCRVDVVTAYETRAHGALPPPPPFDVATFASPSALRAFLAGPGKQALGGKTVAVIGPTTAAEARARGIEPVVAESPSADALIRAIAQTGLKTGPAKGET